MLRFKFFKCRFIGKRSKKLLEHPFEHFTFTLAKNLGMSRKQLMQEMGAGEVLKWMAYELSIDPDKNKDWMKQIEQERISKMEDEERAELLRRQFNIASGIK